MRAALWKVKFDGHLSKQSLFEFVELASSDQR